jgi:flagellar protein FliS
MGKLELRTMDQVNSGINKYVSSGLLTRTPELLILDLYDGCIKFLSIALQGYDEESYDKINNNCNRAGAIIDELMHSLDYKKGGEIAVSFDKLYVYIRKCIIDGNVRKDRQSLENALRITKMMRETWSDGVVKNRV